MKRCSGKVSHLLVEFRQNTSFGNNWIYGLNILLRVHIHMHYHKIIYIYGRRLVSLFANSSKFKARWRSMVRGLSSEDAAIHRYDDTQQIAIQQQKLWLRNPHFFKQVRVSALALFKMTLHCRSGSRFIIITLTLPNKPASISHPSHAYIHDDVRKYVYEWR